MTTSPSVSSSSSARARSGQLLVGLTLVGLLPAILGFALGLNDFVAHVLAGASGLILGAVLAVALIERLLRQQHREHWSPVHDEMRRAMCEGVVEMAFTFATILPSGAAFIDVVADEEDLRPHARIADALRRLVEAAESDAQPLARDLDSERASSRTLFRQVAPVITPLRDAMTSRLIALGDEPALVTVLLAFERAQRQWAIGITSVEHARAPDRFAWECATLTLQAGVEVYSYFVRASIEEPTAT